MAMPVICDEAKGRPAAAGVILAMLLCLLWGNPAAVAAPAQEDCGPVQEGMLGEYPVDFRKQFGYGDKQLILDVEHSFPGKSPRNLSAVLMRIPNHPVALSAMIAIVTRSKQDPPPGADYGLACWFDRASRWVKDDPVPHDLFGRYLSQQGNYAGALAEFQKSWELGRQTANMAYNIGLMNFELGKHDEALSYALKAYEQGFNLPALRDKLKKVGKWQEPVRPPAPPEAGAPEAGASASGASAGGSSADQPGAAIAHDWPAPPEGEDCGTLRHVGMYGPWDYRTDKDKLPVIDLHHFNRDVEMLSRGITGPLPGDIGYVLEHVPNHARALLSMLRFVERSGKEKPTYSNYSMACWLDRAVRWRPEDGTVRAIFGNYLVSRKRYPEAVRQFEQAIQLGGESPNLDYNLGLVYLEMKDFDKALMYARKAYGGGFSLPGLRQRLEKAGKWQTLPDTPAGQPAGGGMGGEANTGGDHDGTH